MTNAYRNTEGTDNNPLNPDLGQTNDQLARVADPDYGDGISTLAGEGRPSAREISNEIFSQDAETPMEAGFSDYMWVWGQFLDHDISLSLTSSEESEEAPIPVPADDALFDPFSTGMVTIPFSRSTFDPDSGSDTSNPRQQLNDITPFIDASNVYGSDAERAAALREDDGRMKVSDDDLLPFNEAGLPNADREEATQFLAGDQRANENVALTSMHTLFVREHNRLVSEFEEANPDWDPETLYQEARRIVEAQIQHITYNEFLPKLLGEDPLEDYDGYKFDLDPQIANVFSTAAYRLGHTMLSSTIHRTDEDGSENSFGDLSLRDAFFQPERLVDEGGIDAILRGVGTTAAQQIDAMIVDDVRNFLFDPPGAGGLDLVSLNIQRGRDHGLPDYNTFREAYGLDRVTNFDEITTNVDLQNKLEALYGDVDNIDVYVGGLSEDPRPGSLLGPLIHAAMVDQFGRLRDADSFWYESRMSEDELSMIKGVTLSDIIERNSGVDTIQDDVFQAMTRQVGTDEGETLVALDEATLLMGLDGEDVLMVNRDASLQIQSRTELHGGDGADRIYGFIADDWLSGDEGDDLLHGEEGNDYLSGGEGNDFINAGSGDDIIDGGTGNDDVVTGMGADRIKFSQGQDVIHDFDVASDVIDFSHFPGVSSLEDLTIESFPAGTSLTDGEGNSVWLIGVMDASQISMDFGAPRPIYSGEDEFDVVVGSAGDDTFVDVVGTQYYFGHHGEDTLVVDANSDDYEVAVTVDGTGYVIWSDSEVEIMWDMEHIQFLDETVDLDPIV
ncbi:MAG: peroxidase family protein [Rhizobiaceae bacterium]